MIPAACAAAAVWLFLVPRRLHIESRLDSAHHRGRRVRRLILLVAAVPAGLALGEPTRVVQLATGAGLVLFVIRQVRKGHSRSARWRRLDDSAEALESLAAELSAGAPPQRAMDRLAHDWSFLVPAATAARLGGDVPGALRAITPTAQPLRDLAAAWQVAERSGAPLADALSRVIRSVDASREARREIQASLGPARATAHTLALLPVFGVGLGSTMGYDPLKVLTETLLGACCLAVGAALCCAGLAWVDLIADRAERA